MMTDKSRPSANNTVRVIEVSYKDIIAFIYDYLPPKIRLLEQLVNFMIGLLAPNGFQTLKSLSVKDCVKYY
jgi:hypothetical protein